jgi:hypothetical protein
VHQYPGVGEPRDFVVAVAELAQYLFVVLLARRLAFGLGAGVDSLRRVGVSIGLGGVGEVPGAAANSEAPVPTSGPITCGLSSPECVGEANHELAHGLW